MQDVIQFETKLARIMTLPENRRDKEKLYNLMSLNELQRKAPFVSTQVEPRESAWYRSTYVFFTFDVIKSIIALGYRYR